MKVLAICPTYGRLPYLGRALASFLSQDHPERTLVIINDDKNVKLTCNYSNVICVNLDKKILLPDKRNLGVNIGKYDMYINYDDDDIFLPERISNKVKLHKEREIESTYDRDAYTVYGSKFDYTQNVPPSVCTFTRDLFYRVNGYTHNVNVGEDWEFFDKISRYETHTSVEGDLDFVYVYSGVNYHTTLEDNDEYTEKIDRIAHDQLVKMDLMGRTFNITPDFETYSKFVTLRNTYVTSKTPISVEHVEESKISIVDF